MHHLQPQSPSQMSLPYYDFLTGISTLEVHSAHLHLPLDMLLAIS